MITSRDGATINYEVEGRGRHVTLVHGVGSHLQAWDGVVAALRDEFTLLRYDLRGHAKSGKPPGPYALDDYVADLAALLDAQSVDRTTLVGFSFGGMIAPAFTVRYPNRVQALAIVSAVASGSGDIVDLYRTAIAIVVGVAVLGLAVALAGLVSPRGAEALAEA